MRDIGSEKIVKHHSKTNKFLQYLHQKQKELGIINKQNNQYKAKCSCKLDKKLKKKIHTFQFACNRFNSFFLCIAWMIKSYHFSFFRLQYRLNFSLI